MELAWWLWSFAAAALVSKMVVVAGEGEALAAMGGSLYLSLSEFSRFPFFFFLNNRPQNDVVLAVDHFVGPFCCTIAAL